MAEHTPPTFSPDDRRRLEQLVAWNKLLSDGVKDAVVAALAEIDRLLAERDTLLYVCKHTSEQLWRMEYCSGDDTRGGHLLEYIDSAIARAEGHNEPPPERTP